MQLVSVPKNLFWDVFENGVSYLGCTILNISSFLKYEGRPFFRHMAHDFIVNFLEEKCESCLTISITGFFRY